MPAEMAAKAAPVESAEQELGQPLELKPKKISSLNVHDEMKTDSELVEAETVLSNPKLSHLFESDKNPKEHKVARVEPAHQTLKEKTGDVEIERDYSSFSEPRKLASVTKEIPVSYSSGPFSVQVAAYSEELQAKERVEALKKLGFPHAYLSSINLGEGKETWYRVWLGYYPSMATAKVGGDALQALGEVKNYLVRKSENSPKKD